MKVLLLDNFHYVKGGAETVYLNTGKLLEDIGIEVIYFSMNWKQNLPSYYSKYFPDGYDFNIHGIRNKIKAFAKYCYNTEASANLRKLIRKTKPDIAHIHLFWGGLTPSILRILKEERIPIVHTVHDYRMICPAYTFKNSRNEVCEKCKGHLFYNALIHKCSKGSYAQSLMLMLEMYYRVYVINAYKYFDHIIYVSEFCKEIHCKYNKQLALVNSSVIYNFANPDLAIYRVDKHVGNYYLYYGRLSYEKGLQTLIKAFSRMPELKLKIVGSGPLENDLLRFCEMNTIHNISFEGYKTGRELFETVANAKYVCIPAEWYENNPMSAIEAMTLGIPVIASNIGGCPEIIEQSQNGFLFQSGDVEGLVKTLKESVNVSDEKYQLMCEYSMKYSEMKFSPEIYRRKLLDIYHDLSKS